MVMRVLVPALVWAGKSSPFVVLFAGKSFMYSSFFSTNHDKDSLTKLPEIFHTADTMY
jgi:hypothetical protein